MKRLFLIVLVLLLVSPVVADTLLIYTEHDGVLGTASVTEDITTIFRDDGLTATLGGNSGYARLTASTTDSKYSLLTRPFYSFNTSVLGTGATITDVKFRSSYYGTGTTNLGNLYYMVTGVNPVNPLSFAASDFQRIENTNLTDTEFTEAQYRAGGAGSPYNSTLNAAGRAYINKTGHTTLTLRSGNDVLNSGTGVTWVSGATSGLYVMFSEYSGAGGANDPILFIEYTTGAPAPDTTPPDSITGLTNTTTNCNNITWGWTNPTTADFNHTMIWRNNTFWTNVSNITTTAFWDGLPENTAITFSSRTCDFIPNCNLTFVNATKTTNFCPVATPTPTPTPTATPTPAPTPALAGCLYYNLTGVYEGLNSSNWTATEGLTTWGVMTTNATQGNTSWWVCIATPTPTPTPPPWQPDINPTTDTHYNWWKLLTDWWWLPLLILAMIIMFTRR